MRTCLAVAVIFSLAGLAGFSQEKKEPPSRSAEFKIPPEEARRENPVRPTEASIQQGQRLFQSQCAMCHGKSGDGKGDLAETMKLKLRNYRDPQALKAMTDGELFYILTHGKDQMPGQEDRLKTEQKWHLINYIRSLPLKEPAPKPKEERPQ